MQHICFDTLILHKFCIRLRTTRVSAFCACNCNNKEGNSVNEVGNFKRLCLHVHFSVVISDIHDIMLLGSSENRKQEPEGRTDELGGNSSAEYWAFFMVPPTDRTITVKSCIIISVY